MHCLAASFSTSPIFLLVAAIDIAGMAVAFPVGIGLALVIGVIMPPIASIPRAIPTLLFIGVACVAAGNHLGRIGLPTASHNRTKDAQSKESYFRFFAVVDGTVLSIRRQGDAATRTTSAIRIWPGSSRRTPHLVFFAAGSVPIELRVQYASHDEAVRRRSSAIRRLLHEGQCLVASRRHSRRHDLGRGNVVCNHLAGDRAGYAISYGLGQGATMVAALWGVFVWKEFQNARPGTNRLLALMFAAVRRRVGTDRLRKYQVIQT